MDINEMIEAQRRFDSLRETTFAWSSPISEKNSSALVHNVLSLAGEVGELANLVKKYERGDFSYNELMKLVPGELADVLIYLIKISYQAGLDLERAFVDKLSENEVRFPRSKNETASPMVWGEEYPSPRTFLRMPSSELKAEVDKWAKRASLVASHDDIRALEDSADRSGVSLPSSSEEKFAAAILAIIFAEAGLLEGRPSEREAIWERLAPAAELFNLKQHNLASLTSNVTPLTRIVEGIFASREVSSANG